MKTLFIYLISVIMFSNTRDVYIFYSTSGTAQKDKQVSELNSDKKGLQDRDIMLHVILTTEAKEVKKWNIDTTASFTFLLVGKDGGEKLRSSSLVTKEKLFATIDAMPMHRQEIKKGN